MRFLAKLFVGVLGCESAIDVGAANASANSLRTIAPTTEWIVLLARGVLFEAMVLGRLGEGAALFLDEACQESCAVLLNEQSFV